jgi:nitrous oxidase accessory protein NosD
MHVRTVLAALSATALLGTGFAGVAQADSVGSAGSEAVSTPCEPALVPEGQDRMGLQADCTTDDTIWVQQGVTLDGNGHTITAVDPADGHFTGAVVENAGTEASVTNLGVTTSGLADVCDSGDERLRGIMLDGASGAITDNRVFDVHQGDSGCQEGNAIEVRNAPFDDTGESDVQVTVSGNEVSDYQKTGVLVNGSVDATVANNAIDGLGPVPYIAQNGVQIGFGATASVEDNTIADNYYTGNAEADSCGLLIYQADGVKQRRNSFHGNERDLCNYGRGGASQ